MEENAAAFHTAKNSVQALGKGFDVNFDTRLLYCKGVAGSKVVEIDEEHKRDLWLYDNLVVPNVSRDIENNQDPVNRNSSGVCNYHEMVEYFNKRANLSGNVPLGSFNAAFSLTGSKHIDAAATKTLCMDGYFIPLSKFELTKSSLVLQESVKRAVPTSWDPPALARVVIRRCSVAKAYILNPQVHHRSVQMQRKYDVTVIFRRRGGDDLEQSHTRWEKTVKYSPDVIGMQFVPITSLLEGVAGKEHLSRAIALYLEYKPQIEELRYFLEFQVSRVWAPLQDRLPGHQRKEPVCPSLQFSMMGQRLYVSQDQISVGRKPVTGIRLCLEGLKQNRLSIHIQHLQCLPKILRPYWDTHVAIGAPKWLGPEEQDSRWFEPVKWKNFSHVSTAPIESPEAFIGDSAGVHIITGAQLGVWDFGSRNVLYMKLLYSRLPGCTVRRSLWDHTPDKSKRTVGPGDSSSGSSGNNRLAKFVDMAEMSKGPADPPGHWVVTGGKLGVEKGKIVLRLKYSLLNY
ncbi:MACPF domain-containing protein CAD1-like isoform X2 [Cynara cardunculus var. scolymus]|uniref:MACPF domain-containing protein CAD1-like isoform X2 n=1 Tax=Cynara cardunculus var. scolymus TaxID=59895 RepID=UPI000D628A61|nr:MACPF domain-containing protein CAD1-like isoform X2 [Cynara cardunculus var. scolymus]